MKRFLLCIACLFALTFVSSRAAIIEVAPAGAWGVLGISGGASAPADGPNTYYYPAGITVSSNDSVTHSGYGHSSYVYGGLIAVGSAGTVTEIGIMIDNDAGEGPYNINIGLYNSSLELLAECTDVIAAGDNGALWTDCTVSQAVTATNYYVFYNGSDDAASMAIDGGETGYYGTCAYSAGAMCDPPTSVDSEATGYMARMYVD